MKKTLLTLVCFSLAACMPATAAKHRHHHRHHSPPAALAQQASVAAPTPVYAAPLGPRPAPFWGSYGARDEVWGACGHMIGVFSCPGN